MTRRYVNLSGCTAVNKGTKVKYHINETGGSFLSLVEYGTLFRRLYTEEDVFKFFDVISPVGIQLLYK